MSITNLDFPQKNLSMAKTSILMACMSFVNEAETHIFCVSSWISKETVQNTFARTLKVKTLLNDVARWTRRQISVSTTAMIYYILFSNYGNLRSSWFLRDMHIWPLFIRQNTYKLQVLDNGIFSKYRMKIIPWSYSLQMCAWYKILL